MAMEQKIGALTSFAGVSNLNGLPEGHAKPFGRVDFSANEYPNAKFMIGINFSGVSPVDGGSVDIYINMSLEDQYWTGDINPTATTDQSSKIRNNLQLIKSLEVDNAMSDASLMYVCNDLGTMIGDMTEYWSLVVWNNSGVTLPSTGHVCKYVSTSYEN